jgi:phage terminase large subunit-like protein
MTCTPLLGLSEVVLQFLTGDDVDRLLKASKRAA